jgi:hypothetical protein
MLMMDHLHIVHGCLCPTTAKLTVVTGTILPTKPKISTICPFPEKAGLHQV